MKFSLYIQLFLLMLCSYGALSQPTITSFSPTSGQIGSIVTITGTNFSSTPTNNVVYFGATKASVVSASTTSLSVVVPVGTTYQSITVTTNNLTAYSVKPFTVTFNTVSNDFNFTASSFSTYSTLSAGSPMSVEVGDIDGDGKVDIIKGGYYSSGIAVYRNTSTLSTISFANEIFFSGGSVYDIALADIDGDGKLDVAIAKGDGNIISVLRNTSTPGNISFVSAVSYSGSLPYSVNFGDLDNDGKPDMAIANNFSNNVSIKMNTSTVGNISFTNVSSIVANLPTSATIADIDADGKQDIVVSEQGSYQMSVYRNISLGSSIAFMPKIILSMGIYYPCQASVGDLDGDDKADIAAVTTSGRISVFRNTGSVGTISFASRVDLDGGSYGLSINDINGDGKPEIVSPTTSFNSNSVLIHKNNSSAGNLMFAPAVYYPSTGLTATNFSQQVAVADFNGDGKAEIVATVFLANFLALYNNLVAGTAVPVSLINFNCQVKNKLVDVYWQTANELNAAHFEVEHCLDGISFSKIGEIKAIGNSTKEEAYSYYHKNPAKGFNYYRLKMVDLDEKYVFSKSIKAFVDPESETLNIFPNPAKDYFIVEHPIVIGNVQLKILDMSGKLLKSITPSKNTRETKISSRNIKPGLYTIILSTEVSRYSKIILIE